MAGPASRTRVRRPRSQSSFAAQPPLMPEPTTMASYSRASERNAAIEPARDHRVAGDLLHHALGSEVAVDGELLQRVEGVLRAAFLALHPVQTVEDGLLVRSAEIDEYSAVFPATP